MSLPTRNVAGVTLRVLCAVAMGTLLARAVLMVAHGQGARGYKNAYGLSIFWVGVLTLAVAFVVAILAGLAIRWWQQRDDRATDKLLYRDR